MSLGKFVWLQVRKHQDCACIYFHGVAYKSAHMGQARMVAVSTLCAAWAGVGVLREPFSEGPVTRSVIQPRPWSDSPAPWGGVRVRNWAAGTWHRTSIQSSGLTQLISEVSMSGPVLNWLHHPVGQMTSPTESHVSCLGSRNHSKYLVKCTWSFGTTPAIC